MPADVNDTHPTTAQTPAFPVAPTPPLPSAVSIPEHRTVQLVDIEEPTIRRAGDLVYAILNAVGIVFLLLIAVYGRETAAGVTEDMLGAVENSPLELLMLPIALVEGLVAFGVPVAVTVSLILKQYWRTILRAATAGVLGVALALLSIELIGLLPFSNPLRLGMTLAGLSLVPPLSSFTTALSAFLTAVGKASNASAVRWSWYALLFVLVLAVLQSDLNIVGATASLLLGRMVGYLTRWTIGVHSTRANGAALIAGLRRAGLDPERVVRTGAGPGEPRAWRITSTAPVGYNAQAHVDGATRARHEQISPDPQPIDEETFRLMGSRQGPPNSLPRSYAVWSGNERSDVTVLDDDRQVVGFLANLWERIRIQGTDPRVSPGMRENAERAVLMTYAARAAGVRTPEILGFAQIADSVILVERHIPGGRHLTQFDDLPVEVLDQLWVQLRDAHDHGIAHRSLTAEHIVIDEDEAPWIVGWSDGEITASSLSRRMDLTQMLCLLAGQFGTQRALASANRNLTEAQLASIAPLLQRVTLPAATRDVVPKSTLSELREALTKLIPEADSELLPLQRFAPKTILTVSLLLIAIFIVLGTLNFEDVVASFKQANPWWLLAAFGAGLTTYVGAALGLVAFTVEKLSVWRTTLVELAAAIVSIVAPAGVGPAAVEIRYLNKQGVSAPISVATVSLTAVSRGVGTVLLLALVTFASGRGGSITLPSTALLIGIGLVIVIVGILAAIPAIRTWAWAKIDPILKQIWPRIVWVLGNPKRLLVGLTGSVIMTVGYVAAFGLTLNAFGYTLPLAVLAITYLASNAAGAIVPTPAGIGAVELALTSGLTVAGVPASVALSATLLFRVLTLWARVPLGWLSLRHLQKHDVL